MDQFLAQAGIVPSYDRTYSLGEIETALKTSHGADVTIQCQHGSLTEIWYYFNVAGQLQTGNFVATNPGLSRTFLLIKEQYRGLR